MHLSSRAYVADRLTCAVLLASVLYANRRIAFQQHVLNLHSAAHNIRIFHPRLPAHFLSTSIPYITTAPIAKCNTYPCLKESLSCGCLWVKKSSFSKSLRSCDKIKKKSVNSLWLNRDILHLSHCVPRLGRLRSTNSPPSIIKIAPLAVCWF